MIPGMRKRHISWETPPCLSPCHTYYLVDGSVHAVKYGVDPTVWGRLCRIDDGEETGFED
jgi:hypothetical protein